jgi:hypothetical protein
MRREGVTSEGIPRRPRGAFISFLDDLLESGALRTSHPPNVLQVWSLALAASLAFYWLWVREGAQHPSDIGWFLTIMVSSPIFSNGRKFSKQLLYASIPLIASSVLMKRADSAARLALQDLTAPLLFHYAAAAGAFLIFMFLWIIVLPGVYRPDYISAKLWQTSRVILFLIGCVMGLFEAREMLSVLHHSPFPMIDQFHWLQGWASRSTFVLFVLFLGRTLLPLSAYAVMTRMGIQQPRMRSSAPPS